MGADIWKIRGTEPAALTFTAAGGKTVLTIHPDGRIERGDGFTTDDAASMAFFDVLSTCLPCYMAELRQRAERAERELAVLKASLTNVSG